MHKKRVKTVLWNTGQNDNNLYKIFFIHVLFKRDLYTGEIDFEVLDFFNNVPCF